MTRLPYRAASVAWPAFLGAGVLEMVVFAFVDPSTLSLPGGAALGLSATTVYSLAFFAFWMAVSAACALTERLDRDELPLFGFDVDDLDWRHYYINVQVPGLETITLSPRVLVTGVVDVDSTTCSARRRQSRT